MSYIYLQEQGEESSVESFSDINHVVLLSWMTTQEKSSFKGSATAVCHGFLSGTTSLPLTQNHGEGLQMLSVEDSPAKTSAQQEQAKDLKVIGQDFGLKCEGSFARWNPSSSLWKTRQYSLFGGLESFSETWPQWGIMHNGECWELQMSACVIAENEFGYLPTVMHSEATMHVGGPLRSRETWQNTSKLSHRLIGLWMKWKARESNARHRESKAVCHPIFAEWMMGWPIHWTDLRELATDRFHKWLRSHGES